mmetsp:Transcript_22828/g.41121  ORF Transcript_22828/g.41121 Transcript_22828/m.41121 type:complete len:467 (+) Transcript_22828:582-1982(+)
MVQKDPEVTERHGGLHGPGCHTAAAGQGDVVSVNAQRIPVCGVVGPLKFPAPHVGLQDTLVGQAVVRGSDGAFQEIKHDPGRVFIFAGVEQFIELLVHRHWEGATVQGGRNHPQLPRIHWVVPLALLAVQPHEEDYAISVVMRRECELTRLVVAHVSPGRPGHWFDYWRSTWSSRHRWLDRARSHVHIPASHIIHSGQRVHLQPRIHHASAHPHPLACPLGDGHHLALLHHRGRPQHRGRLHPLCPLAWWPSARQHSSLAWLPPLAIVSLPFRVSLVWATHSHPHRRSFGIPSTFPAPLTHWSQLFSPMSVTAIESLDAGAGLPRLTNAGLVEGTWLLLMHNIHDRLNGRSTKGLQLMFTMCKTATAPTIAHSIHPIVTQARLVVLICFWLHSPKIHFHSHSTAMTARQRGRRSKFLFTMGKAASIKFSTGPRVLESMAHPCFVHRSWSWSLCYQLLHWLMFLLCM